MPGCSTPLDRYRGAELPLDDLVHAASGLLRRLGVRAEDGRVAEEVDARGVRYYQTLGVVDKPLRYDGRRAVYGFRHLLQLLAVKKLQQEGHPLSLIQQSLAGRSTDALEHALSSRLGTETDDLRLKPDPTDATRRLVAAAVAPGVTLMVDPSVVPDPDAVIAMVEHVLATARKER